MAISKEKVLEDLKQKFSDNILEITAQFGDDIICIKKEALLDIVNFLREEPYAFTMLLDLTCVDYMGEEERFEMVYHLFSLSNKLRLRFKTRLSEDDCKIDSLTPIFKNANWLEREAYDMFGVHFEGHPYLRRLFMYDGFEGHPLRKDYPLHKHQPKIPLRK
ncbi:MAG: NADH-quinone oxidoreductase subunit C [Candidatus Aminicenantes bacterium]|nr:MAG: NADH-quinone oxidoreductase subunit C [Candidatus Aminicenantes bacterium]